LSERIAYLPAPLVEGWFNSFGNGEKTAQKLMTFPLQYKDRDELENDPTCRQVIPYVIVEEDWYLGLGNPVLCHRRAGTEKRLHGQLSVGFGGHVREPETVSEGLVRELKEELGLTIDFEYLTPLGGILLSENLVDRVHVGVVFLYSVSYEDEDLWVIDGGEIQDTTWEPPALLITNNSLETWGIEALRLREEYYERISGGLSSGKVE